MKRAAAAATSPRRRKSAAELREHALVIIKRLKKEYPDAHCELDFRSPYQLLVATILSAQCTDKRVNIVTPRLFATYPTPRQMAEAPPEKVEEIVKTTGFFRAKTKSLQGMSEALVERHEGEVPDTMDELTALRGVGRKTANVVLGNAFGKAEGIVVDTHVGRVSVRLALTNETDPVKVEEKLMALVPRRDWTIFSHLLIFHGRRVCVARLPKCGICVLNDVCPSRRRDIRY
ncbi:MAG TPA: endonuclease III [Gemmatimonadaceae bacterium]|nr:endonuclease III [Gemmatimonadaceae bacterium]